MGIKDLFKYRFVSRFWAVMFALLAIALLLLPENLQKVLDLFAPLFGSTISVPEMSEENAMLMVLGVGYLATISMLAWISCTDADTKSGTFKALILAKLVTAVMFLFLTFTYTTGWLLPAFTDLFIAGTLVFSSGYTRGEP